MENPNEISQFTASTCNTSATEPFRGGKIKNTNIKRMVNEKLSKHIRKKLSDVNETSSSCTETLTLECKKKANNNSNNQLAEKTPRELATINEQQQQQQQQQQPQRQQCFVEYENEASYIASMTYSNLLTRILDEKKSLLLKNPQVIEYLKNSANKKSC